MICVKCGGRSVFPAINEAPDGACDWRKCMSCGMRWDPTKDVLDTVKRAFEEWQPGEETDRVNVHGDDETDERGLALDDNAALDVLDDLDEPVVTQIDLAMKDVLVKRGPKMKKAKEVRMAIGGTCTTRGCRTGAAHDSVKCEKHRDIQREKNAQYQGRALKGQPGRPKKVADAVVHVPARREPDTLPTPRPVVMNGNVFSVLDAAIVSATADVQALERTREILARQQ